MLRKAFKNYLNSKYLDFDIHQNLAVSNNSICKLELIIMHKSVFQGFWQGAGLQAITQSLADFLFKFKHFQTTKRTLIKIFPASCQYRHYVY